MVKPAKTALALALAACMSLSVTVGANSAKATDGAPVYTDGSEFFKNEFMVGAWCEPNETDTQIELFKECGFNVLYLNNSVQYNSGIMNRYIDLAEKHDLGYVFSVGMNRSDPVSIRMADAKTQERLKNDPRFLGVQACDEPLGSAKGDPERPYVKKNEASGIYKDFLTIYHYLADEYLYLTETYGDDKIFDVVIGDNPIPGGFGYGSFEAMEEVVLPVMQDSNRTLDIDRYPFLDDTQKEIDPMFCNTSVVVWGMNKYANAVNKWNGVKYRIYTYGNMWHNNEAREYYDERNETYQFYLSMCFGFNAFVTFQYNGYWNLFGDSTDTIRNYYGLSEYWHYNKLAVEEVKKYDYIYLPFSDNWQGAMMVEGTKNHRTDANRLVNAVTDYGVEFKQSHPRIDSWTATQDTLMGTYKDPDGRDGFMISNQANPNYKISDTVRIKFNNANKVLAVVDGVQQTLDLVDGVLELNLKYGGGAFVVPYNA